MAWKHRRLLPICHNSEAICEKEKDQGWLLADSPIDAGRTTVLVYHVALKHIVELGRLVKDVADGHDARKVFRQAKRTKPKKTEEHLCERSLTGPQQHLPAAKDGQHCAVLA